ncbi:MAG: ATP-binding cassette domain-containing protein [Pseudomonadota bacterium]
MSDYLIDLQDISYSIGDQKILHQANLTLVPKERVCLIGRNGAGKSTLFRLLKQQITPDVGEIRFKKLLRVSELQQSLPQNCHLTVAELLMQGLKDITSYLEEFEALHMLPHEQQDENRIVELQTLLDETGGWNPQNRVDTIASQLDLPLDRLVSNLSGGWQRRALLGLALIQKPELLLLDEPTNHLDITTIQWLESMLTQFDGGLLFITHDRRFLREMATRIIEIDRTKLYSWPGDYDDFLSLKDESITAEKHQHATFDKKLAQEEVWIRKGVKARGTRNEGRVRQLESLREVYQQREKQLGAVQLSIEEASPSGKQVFECKDVTYVGIDNKTLIKDFSIKIRRGDRIGLIGNNGIGKSTLVRLLINQLQPTHGTITQGTNLEIGYIDQMRDIINWDKTAAENLGQGKDHIIIKDREVHVVGYLKRFLFSPKKAMTPMNVLSGGECHRLLLAKLFAQSTNVLLLDEPTNDLDLETIETLEQELQKYAGTLLIVSHDRDFLDKVVQHVLVFEESGLEYYNGNYSDWARRQRPLASADFALTESATPIKHISSVSAITPATASLTPIEPKKSKKLTLMEQKELSQLPKQITQLEKQIAELKIAIAKPSFFEQVHQITSSTLQELADLEHRLESIIERWIELDGN